MPLWFRLIAALLIALSICPAVFAQEPVSRSRMGRFEQWLSAMVHHTPGEVDTALFGFAPWQPAHWQTLLNDAMVFARGTIDPAQSRFPVRTLNGETQFIIPNYSRPEFERMHLLACAFSGQNSSKCVGSPLEGDLHVLWTRAADARRRGDPHYVLRLAALLHTDLLTWGGTQDTAPNSISATPTRLWLVSTDGQSDRIRSGGIHWQIAYGVLDPILDADIAHARRPRDPWVRDWYVAAGHWMQRSDLFDHAHVAHALRYFPDDPDLRFLSATLHEIDAGPELQNAVRSMPLPYGITLSIENPTGELRDAASDLRRALVGRPDWSEAHLRLGRVLFQIGEPDAAADQLQLALGPAGDTPLAYYAALFLGAVRDSQGRVDEARRLYERASALDPAAQSPYLALSHLARRQGDRVAALASLQQAFAQEDWLRDPWWDYLSIQARGADARLARLRVPLMEVRR